MAPKRVEFHRHKVSATVTSRVVVNADRGKAKSKRLTAFIDRITIAGFLGITVHLNDSLTMGPISNHPLDSAGP